MLRSLVPAFWRAFIIEECARWFGVRATLSNLLSCVCVCAGMRVCEGDNVCEWVTGYVSGMFGLI